MDLKVVKAQKEDRDLKIRPLNKKLWTKISIEKLEPRSELMCMHPLLMGCGCGCGCGGCCCPFLCHPFIC